MLDLQAIEAAAAARLQDASQHRLTANPANRLIGLPAEPATVSQLAALAISSGSHAPADPAGLPAGALPKRAAPRQDRPFRLSRVEADVAHADPWTETACARFVARVASIRRRGFDEQDAEDLAERLHLRDVQGEGRALCLSCSHLAGTTATGWRCRNHRRAEMPRDLAADIVSRLPQRCPGLAETAP